MLRQRNFYIYYSIRSLLSSCRLAINVLLFLDFSEIVRMPTAQLAPQGMKPSEASELFLAFDENGDGGITEMLVQKEVVFFVSFFLCSCLNAVHSFFI